MIAIRKKTLFLFPKRLFFVFILITLFQNYQAISPFLEVDYSFVGTLSVRLINGIMSTPIRFIYRDFQTVDRLFCKYSNTTDPFASFGSTLGTTTPDRILKPLSSDYSVVNSSIGTSGYFGIKILADIDRDHERTILCQYSTQFTIGSSTTILLQVISPVKITPFMIPRNPSYGEPVEAGCIIEGYPFPVVEIITPNNYYYSTTQINNSTTKLTVYKYAVKIPSLNELWDGERIFCTAFQTSGPTRSSYVTIKSGDRNPVLMTGLAIGGSGALVIIILIAAGFAIFLRKRRRSRKKNKKNRFEPRGPIATTNNGPSSINPSEYYSTRNDSISQESNVRVFRERSLNSYEVSTAAFV